MREQLDQCYLYAMQEVTTIKFGYRTVFGCLQKSYIPLCVRLYAENSWESTTNDAHTVEVGNSPSPERLCSELVDGPRLNVELTRSDWKRRTPAQPKMMECVRCGKRHSPPRRGDSITCECGLVFW